MAKTQTKNGRWRRFFGWFGRHKVTTVFTALVLVGSVIALGLEIQYHAQLYLESRRFAAGANKMLTTKKALAALDPTSISYEKMCQHSNFGAFFENDTINCSTGARSIYLNLSQPKRDSILNETLKVLMQQGFNVFPDKTNQSQEGIASYAFGYDHLTCFFNAWYYDQSTPTYDRDSNMPATGTETKTEVYCGSKALKDYFPRTD